MAPKTPKTKTPKTPKPAPAQAPNKPEAATPQDEPCWEYRLVTDENGNPVYRMVEVPCK